MLHESHYSQVINKRFIKFSKIAISVLFMFSVLRFYQENFSIAIADAMGGTLMLINLKSNLTISKKITLFLFITVVMFLIFIYHSFLDPTLWHWGYSFPAFAYLLNDRNNGKKWSVFAGMVVIVVLLLQELFHIETGHTSYEFFIFLSVYTLISVLMHHFQKEIDLYIVELNALNNSLHTLVAEEVSKNKHKDEILHNQAKHAQMGEMLSMIAHQWRQPLNAISASVIKMQLENEIKQLPQNEIEDTSEFIQEKIQDLSEIINSFLELSKPTKNDKTFLLSAVIDKVLKMTLTQLESHNIIVQTIYDVEYKDSAINGSGHLYEQVLLNLLMNTKDAFDEKKEIEDKSIIIYVDAWSNVQIKDNAGGIETALVDKVFNPYFTTKEEGKGVGLGLYMSRKIMQSHFNGDLIYMPNKLESCFNIIINKEHEDV